MSKLSHGRRGKPDHKKHGILHGIFQGCGHGTFGYLSMISVPNLPSTGDQEKDFAILTISLIIAALAVAKGCKWF